jgi:HEAT repeat protein
MGHLGDKRALPVLMEALNNAQVENQIYTLWALGSIGDNSAVPGVLKQLRHEDAAVRKVAAYVLGSFKDESAIHDLQVALNDVNNEVQWNAAMSLALLGEASGAELLTKLLDRSYVEGLDAFTVQQKTELMVNAVKCLAAIKHEPARDKIAELSRNDSNLAVRDASLEALKKY